MSAGAGPVTVALTGTLPLLLVTAALLAAPVSLAALALYRRAVLRSMGSRGRRGGDWPAAPQPAGPAAAAADPAVLLRRSLSAPWRLAAVYAAGGLGYALVLSIGSFAASGVEVSVYRFLIVFWNYAWPVALATSLLATASRAVRLGLLLAYALVFALLGAVGLTDAGRWGELPVLWAATNALATLLLLGFLHRRVRAVGPLVFSFLFLAVLGSAAAAALLGASEWGMWLAVDVGQLLGLGGREVFAAMLLVGFAAFAVLGWLAARWIRARYERKQLSDQSILLDAGWLVFALVHGFQLVTFDARWMLAGPAAFLVYKAVTHTGLALMGGGTGSGARSPRLLLLRVFSLGRRSERLFDALALHWRYVGSIRLIAGPDLATTTVEPHEFLDFLAGRLARRFVDGPEALEQRLAEMDLAPDRDGRYRVSEFFCRADTWQQVLARLVGDSDVILMDLRGFSDQNDGCRHEVEALVELAPLSRVVLVTDGTTDEPYLDEVVAGAWRRMSPRSPNRGSTPERLRRVHLPHQGGPARRAVLRALFEGTQDPALPVPVS